MTHAVLLLLVISGPGDNPREYGPGAASIVGSDKAAKYVRLMPRLSDPLPPGIVFYDDVSHPTYQQVQGRIYPSGQSFGGIQNGNIEHPWRVPFGFHTAKEGTWSKFNWIKLPMPLPVRREAGRWRWLYPLETVVGEVLLIKDPAGQWRPFEMRTRRREPYGWEPTIYRPVKDFEELVRLVGDDFEATYQQHTISDEEQTLEIKGSTLELPAFRRRTVDSLLSRRFRPVTGFYKDAHGPSTQSEYGLTPPGFIGGAFSIDSHTCSQCPRDAGRRFNLRGDDGLFSFSPLDAAGPSKKLLKAGLIRVDE